MSLFNNIMSWISNPLGSLMADKSQRGKTIWNNPQSSKYEVDSITESGNEFGGTGLDPNGFVSGIWNDLTGVTSQSREFAQQEYLMDKQNAYNHPVAQMQRMKEAGINPVTAAAGISQGGNESAQAPAVSSNVNGVANGVANAAGAIASMGAGAASFAQAGEIGLLQGLKAEQIKADTIKSLEDSGLAHWNAVSVATLLPTLNDNSKADFYLKLAQIDNTRAQYQNLLEEHNRILADIDLMKKQGNLMDVQMAFINEQKRWQVLENDFFASHGYHSDSPLDVSLRNAVVSGNFDEAYAIGEASETASYSSALGEYIADKETIGERTENKNEADIQFQSKLKMLETNQDFVKGLYKSVMEFFGSGSNDPKALVRLVLSLITQFK